MENKVSQEIAKSDHSKCDNLNDYVYNLEEKNHQFKLNLDNAKLEISKLQDDLKVYKFKVLELKDRINQSESDDDNFIRALSNTFYNFI